MEVAKKTLLAAKKDVIVHTLQTLTPRFQTFASLRDVSRRAGGFTLVEVALALGIAVFSCVVVLGLFGSGLSNFDQSQSRAASARIAQGLINEISQSDWTSLVKSNGDPQILSIHYYDNQGADITPSGQTAVPSQTVYVAKPVIYARDTEAGVNYADSSMGNPEFVRVMVQVLNLPGGKATWFSDTDAAWTIPSAQEGRLGRYSFMVSRSSHSP